MPPWSGPCSFSERGDRVYKPLVEGPARSERTLGRTSPVRVWNSFSRDFSRSFFAAMASSEYRTRLTLCWRHLSRKKCTETVDTPWMIEVGSKRSVERGARSAPRVWLVGQCALLLQHALRGSSLFPVTSVAPLTSKCPLLLYSSLLSSPSRPS